MPAAIPAARVPLSAESCPAELLEQVPATSLVYRERMDLQGTPLWWIPHSSSCQVAHDHRDLLWQRGPALFRTAIYDDWHRQVAYETCKLQWDRERLALSNLLALVLGFDGQAPEPLVGGTTRWGVEEVVIDRQRLVVSRPVSTLLTLLAAARAASARELRGPGRSQGSENGEAQSQPGAQALDSMRTLIDRLEALGVLLIHPQLVSQQLFLSTERAGRPLLPSTLPTGYRLWSLDWGWSILPYRESTYEDITEADLAAACLERGSDFAATLFWAVALPLAEAVGEASASAVTQLVISQVSALRAALAQRVVEQLQEELLLAARLQARRAGLLPPEQIARAVTFEALPGSTLLRERLIEGQERWKRFGEQGKQLDALIKNHPPSPAPAEVATLPSPSFWRIAEEPLLETGALALRGTPLAWVNAHRRACPGEPHIHILWSRESRLLRATIPLRWCKERWYIAQHRRLRKRRGGLLELLALQLATDQRLHLTELSGASQGRRGVMLGSSLLQVSGRVLDHLRAYQEARWRLTEEVSWLHFHLLVESGSLAEGLVQALPPLDEVLKLAQLYGEGSGEGEQGGEAFDPLLHAPLDEEDWSIEDGFLVGLGDDAGAEPEEGGAALPGVIDEGEIDALLAAASSDDDLLDLPLLEMDEQLYETAENERGSIQEERRRVSEAEAVLQRQRWRHGRLMQNRARALAAGDSAGGAQRLSPSSAEFSAAHLYEEYRRADQQLADFEEQWRQFFSRLCELPQVFLESSQRRDEASSAPPPAAARGPCAAGGLPAEGSGNPLGHLLRRGRSWLKQFGPLGVEKP